MNRIQVVTALCTCFQSNRAMEFLPCNSKKMELLYGAALFIFACAVASAEEASPDKNSQCHNYAGGHVYPGEAFRVPVSDHSLHLSKAKSKFFSLHRLVMSLLARWKARDFSFWFLVVGSYGLVRCMCSQDNRHKLCVTIFDLCMSLDIRESVGIIRIMQGWFVGHVIRWSSLLLPVCGALH